LNAPWIHLHPMGGGSSTSKTKTVPLPDEKITTIVPAPPALTTQPPSEITSLPPTPGKNVTFTKQSAFSRLSGPLPTGWRAGEQLSLEDAKQRWAKHQAVASHAHAHPHIERNIKRAPTRVAMNVLSVWEDADFALSPGDVVMGRYKVQGALEPPSLRAFEVIDSTDDSACLLKVQPPATASDVLQALAKHEAIRRHAAGERFFLHYKDAFLAPETGNWAVVVEQERSTLRSNFFTGSNPSEGLVRKIGQIASAALQALDRLHHGCWVHTDISLDTIVLDMNGCWKLAGLESAKALPKGGGGVVARNAANRRIRPPEVLLGYPANEASDVFDLGIALFEAATGTEVMDALKGSAPGLLQEFDACMDLLGALPQELIENSPEKETTCTPEGGFLRSVKRGSKETLEVVRPGAAKLKGSMSYKLDQGRLAGNSAQLKEFRAFLQRLLQVDPVQRPSAADALNDVFLTHLAAGGKMKRASIKGGEAAASSIVFRSASQEGSSSSVEDDEELQKLLKEGEGLLSTGGIAASAKDSDEPDEPIDTKRRLSYAKIDIHSHAPAFNAGASKVKFSKMGDDVHHVHSALTMLPGTVEDDAEEKPGKLRRQQTGYVKPGTNLLEEEDEEESDEEEKQVSFSASVNSPNSQKIKRQQTKFERVFDDDKDEIE